MAAPTASASAAPPINFDDFDLEGYISNYTGNTKIARLQFIAEQAKGTPLEIEALRMAANELKQTQNTQRYKAVAVQLSELSKKDPVDFAWIDAIDKKAGQTHDKLDAELQTYRTNLIKESIRMGYNDLGDFFYNRGDFSNAFKNYVRTRDYCTTSQHMLQMCLAVVKVSLALNNYAHVSNYASKALSTPDIINPVTMAKLQTANGLAYIDQANYKLAARHFLDTPFELGNNFNDVIAPQDVALYGTLCALASFDRAELKKKVLDNVVFKQFLELTPRVRELISDFYGSRYASCLNTLAELRNTVRLDYHLHRHLDRVYDAIRRRSMVQYFSPFLSVDLRRMASAFNTTIEGIESDLTRLITDGQISARIDSHNKVLYARHADQRSATFQRAVEVGEMFQRNTKAMLLRVNLMRNDFVVKPPSERGDKDDRDPRDDRHRDGPL